MPKIIELDELCFSYNGDPILKRVRLHIEQGEFIGIIGPNGGGKTTLLKILMGFLKPSSGGIHVQGRIGYVPQGLHTDREFPITVLELVLLGALFKTGLFGIYPKAIKEKANTLLKRLGLEKHAHKVFGSLSGGLAQRALLARALLSDPDILLLDEPTSNIDAGSSHLIFELIQELKGKKTILLVTHDLGTIVEKVDRVLCVQGHISSFLPKEICEHFALGLYHTPLIGIEKNHFNIKKEENALCTHP